MENLADELDALGTTLYFAAVQMAADENSPERLVPDEELSKLVRFVSQRLQVLSMQVRQAEADRAGDMAGIPGGEELVATLGDLAERVGVSQRTVKNYRKQGMPVGRPGEYNVKEAQEWIVRRALRGRRREV